MANQLTIKPKYPQALLDELNNLHNKYLSMVQRSARLANEGSLFNIYVSGTWQHDAWKAGKTFRGPLPHEQQSTD